MKTRGPVGAEISFNLEVVLTIVGLCVLGNEG